MKYNVISPDGFSITFDETYNTIKEVKKAFNEWKKRYKLQGYYSSTQYGRIPLKDLESYCTIIEIN
jgi:hypothetical protein